MRLTDIVNQIRRRVSEATNIIRYPVQTITQAVRRTGQQTYENIQLPVGKQPLPSSASRRSDTIESQTAATTATPTLVQQTQEATISKANIGTEINAHSGQAARHNLRVGLPLPSGTLLKSRWNSYTVGDCFQETERTRLYRGINRSNEPILIKEYRLFDRVFNFEEIENRQKAFERLIELNLKISRGPDFRIVKLVDAIVLPKECCCYLIAKPIDHHTTLAMYLSEQAYQVMPPKNIRIVLNQVLQTLQFLHEAYRVHFPKGQFERGLPHGNLSLNSLLIRQLRPTVPCEQQFFIYLTDLELWEHLFYPPTSRRFHERVAETSQDLGSVIQDLADLGLVGFQLAGGTVSSTHKQPFDLETDPAWQELELNDLKLKQFIEHLLGLPSLITNDGSVVPPFRTAEEALLTLRSLPTNQVEIELPEPIEEVESTASNRNRFLSVTLLLLLGTLGLSSWWFWLEISKGVKNNIENVKINIKELLSKDLTTLQSVKKVPSSITYAVEPGGAWESALNRTFIPYSTTGTIFRQTLTEAIQKRYKTIKDIEGDPLDDWASRERFFEQIAAGDVQVGFARLPNDTLANDIPPALAYTTVAHDALAILVPFVDPYTAKDTVGELKGTISLDELRNLYTQPEDVTEFRGKQVKLFFPESEETNRIFKALVLGNDPELIRKFTALQYKAEARDRQWLDAQRQNQDYLNNKLYEKMLVDFETTDRAVIGIGFDRLSQAFGQCSVYPLAIREGMGTYAALVHANGQPIDEDTDLCGAKGSYFPSINSYYPGLVYDLGLVYRENSQAGAKLAELLNTSEGQYLMSEVGLIPMQPVSNLTSAIWDQMDSGLK